MKSVNAIYDGNTIHFLESVPVKGRHEVKVIFTKSLESKAERRQRLLDLSGTWTEDDAKLIEEMVNERKNFFKKRNENDFS
jgi:hypothetical protein